MTEGRVVHEDIAFRDALLLQVAFQNVVCCARVDIVCAEQSELLNFKLFQEVIRCRDRLLVGCRARVENVLGEILRPRTAQDRKAGRSALQ